MRSQSKHLLLALSVTTLLSVPSAALSAADSVEPKATYVKEVVTILRTHATAIRFLVKNDIKYTDNLVRHATGIKRTFGMLGPMDWHVAEAAKLAQEAGSKDILSEEQFEVLADESQAAINDIGAAARRYLRDGNSELVLTSLNKMMASCGTCHSKLPKGTTPSVWSGMGK